MLVQARFEFATSPQQTAWHSYWQFFIFYIFGCSCYFWQHETLSSKTIIVLHQIIQLFILLKCMCFIYRHLYVKWYYIIHTLFIPSLFTGFFSGSLQISVFDFNHFLFTGIFIWFLRGVSQAIFTNFDHRFFQRVFHRLISVQVFSRVLNFEFPQNLGCAKFTGFFTGSFLVTG